MKYIVMNSLRHGTDVDYVKVIVTGPFTTKGNRVSEKPKFEVESVDSSFYSMKLYVQ